jgi:hypothetical protein
MIYIFARFKMFMSTVMYPTFNTVFILLILSRLEKMLWLN